VQEPNQVAEGIQTVLLCGLNNVADQSTGRNASRGVEKTPVLPAHDKGLYAAFGAVIGELQPAVLQIARQVGPRFQK